MNKQSLGALVALNMVLLVALVMVSIGPEPAYGQLRRAEYLLVSGNVEGRNQQDGIFVIELGTSRMIALFFNAANNTVDVVGGRDLSKDMGADRR